MPNDESPNIEQLRADTPGCSKVIHFNNAGASLMPRTVLEKTTGYLQEEANSGAYETAEKHQQELDEIYTSIARLIHAHEDEIAILENATSAWNMAFYAVPFSPGDRILTSVSEYASNYLNYLNLQRSKEVKIEIIPNDRHGQTSTTALAEMMDEDVRLVGITHIPTNSGLVNPAEEIGRILKDYDCYYLLDACQSAGQYPLDVEKIGCDMLSATGRKYLRGPRGTGFLYVNSDALEHLHPPFLDLHSAEWTTANQFEIRKDARKFENWESNYSGIAGLNTAVKYLLELNIEWVWQRIQWLGNKLRVELSKIDGLSLHDIGQRQGGIVTFSIEKTAPKNIKSYLSEHNINVSLSSRSSTRIDMEERNLQEIVRASVHYYNTEEEISCVSELLKNNFSRG